MFRLQAKFSSLHEAKSVRKSCAQSSPSRLQSRHTVMKAAVIEDVAVEHSISGTMAALKNSQRCNVPQTMIAAAKCYIES